MGEDKHWAQSYLIDPFHEPDPSDVTGPNAHFRSTFAPMPSSERIDVIGKQHDGKVERSMSKNNTGSESISTNPYRRSIQSVSSSAQHTGRSRSSSTPYPTPPGSASPHRTHFKEELSSISPSSPRSASGGLSRASSLRERYPGDKSHRPLDMLTHANARANRSPHLKRRHRPGADSVDLLDVDAVTGGSYHHDGPYDAALSARNSSFESSPLAAIRDTNIETLKATPRENVQDSLKHRRPLDGVASIPPGVPDRFGRVYNYEEGTDLNREPGSDYKRWPGMDYHPDDLKGKGEPSYTIEKALKDHQSHPEHGEHANGGGIEMKSQSRSRGKSLSQVSQERVASSNDYSSAIGRSNTTGRRVGDGLMKRFGSLRRRKQAQEA